MSSKPDMTIAVIGLDYVGLPLAVKFGKHRPMTGLEAKRIEEFRVGYDHTREVALEESPMLVAGANSPPKVVRSNKCRDSSWLRPGLVKSVPDHGIEDILREITPP